MKPFGNGPALRRNRQSDQDMKYATLLSLSVLVLRAIALGEGQSRSFDVTEQKGSIVIQATRGNVVVLGWAEARVSALVRSWPSDFLNQKFPAPGDASVDTGSFDGSLRLRDKVDGLSISFQADRQGESVYVWVPETVSIRATVTGGGSIAVRGTKGEIEVECLQGQILLDQIWGPVMAHTLDHDLWARFAALVPEKPNFLSSLNGTVSVLLPRGGDASFELDFFNGEVDTSIPITLVPGSNVWASDGSTVFEPSRSAETNPATIGKGTHFAIKNHNGNIIIKDYETNK